MEPRFTPGPWVWCERANYFGVQVEPGGLVARTSIAPYSQLRATGMANARLIAAAPELLAVLRAARERMLGSSPTVAALRASADAVIAKAEGK